MLRSSSRHLACVLLLTGLVLGPVSAFAEDTVAETPATRFAAKVKTLPAPTAKLGFVFRGTAHMGEQRLGPVRFSAEPSTEGERAVWIVNDRLAFFRGQFRTNQIAILGSDLDLIRGEESGTEPGKDPHKSKFARTAKGLEATHTPKDAEATESTHAVEGPCVMTLSSLLLFARLAVPDDGKPGDDYAMTIFDPTKIASEKPAMQPGTIALAGIQKWNGVNAYIVTAVKNNTGNVRIAIDPATRDILGFQLEKDGAPAPIVFTHGGDTEEQTESETFWTEHPKTAKQAALQAAYAFAAADVDMLERLFNWEAIHSSLPEAQKESLPTADAYREAEMANFRATLKQQAAPALLKGMLPATPLEEEALEGGHVKITFPPQFKSLTLITGGIDGRWYLMRLPGQ